MPDTTFDRQINIELKTQKLLIAGPNGIDVSALNEFSLQFLVTGNNSALNNYLNLVVSNDGENWYEIPIGSTTIPCYINIKVVEPHTQSYFMFIGSEVGSINYINFNYHPNATPPTNGRLDKVFICGKQY